MRFLHTADIHWGMVPDADSTWGKDRHDDIKDCFRRIIDTCREERVDVLLIAGDLFHRQPTTRELEEINYLFGTIPGTHVLIISGENDALTPNAALHSFSFASNVHWFLGEQPEVLYFEDINTEIHALSYRKGQRLEQLLPELPETDPHRIRLLLLHTGEVSAAAAAQEQLAALPYDYIALGHIHKPTELENRRILYAGSPEPLDRTETGSHGIYLGDVNPLTHKVQRLRFLPMASVSYIPLTFQVTPKSTGEALRERIKEEIESRGRQNIYRIQIRGKRAPELVFSFEGLRERFRIAALSDDTEPDYDFVSLYREHPQDLVGFYIRRLLREESGQMSEIEKKALYYGIHALLHSEKEKR